MVIGASCSYREQLSGQDRPGRACPDAPGEAHDVVGPSPSDSDLSKGGSTIVHLEHLLSRNRIVEQTAESATEAQPGSEEC